MPVTFDIWPSIPNFNEAQAKFVHATTTLHWHRKALLKNRSAQWRAGGNSLALLKEEEPTLAWLTAEAEHWMVHWRTVLRIHTNKPEERYGVGTGDG